ncbi:cytochrome P450 [Aspergillus alliaceus]|uniref:cytochrome P450 n=1 Tax=Petromyces alliaceus TaxID=209559 RepID=UPI0012A49083|nr:cytochrome P450 [Aspergillus alliaceus]KAB8231120.1 cytochrome P450 [Aspergillus alliaceus]
MEKSSGSKISTQLVSWLRLAEKDKAYKKRAKAMTDILYAFVEQQLARQKHIPSYVSRLPKRDQVEPGSEEKLVAKGPAQSIYGGGAETKKAQEEIDRVVGTDRLPDISDCNKIPYINVVVKEVLRWHSVTPMGVAHASSKEDIYHSYLIPKEAILVPNSFIRPEYSGP